MSTETMTSRERVRAAVKGLPVDRVPVDFNINPHMACRMMAEFTPTHNPSTQWLANWLWRRFKKKGADSSDLWLGLPIMMNGYANREYISQLGADLVYQFVGNPSRKVYWENRRMRILDAFGSTRGMCGIYAEVIQPAVGKVSDLAEVELPDLSDERYYDPIRQYRQKHPGACIMVETFGVQDFFSTQLWRMDEFMLALYDAPQEIKKFQQKIADWSMDIARRAVKAGADVVLVYEDYGQTGKPLISLEMWREFTYPHLKRLVDSAHEAGAMFMLHSCGYQMPFLPYYVEAGVDVLQSWQPKAGNDLAAAVAQYGDRLAFCAGIDVQMGEMMTAGELRESILESYRVGRQKGRFILGMSHMLQYTMPVENVRTLFETVGEIQAGLHG